MTALPAALALEVADLRTAVGRLDALLTRADLDLHEDARLLVGLARLRRRLEPLVADLARPARAPGPADPEVAPRAALARPDALAGHPGAWAAAVAHQRLLWLDGVELDLADLAVRRWRRLQELLAEARRAGR
jgi:hypothetical protein